MRTWKPNHCQHSGTVMLMPDLQLETVIAMLMLMMLMMMVVVVVLVVLVVVLMNGCIPTNPRPMPYSRAMSEATGIHPCPLWSASSRASSSSKTDGPTPPAALC